MTEKIVLIGAGSANFGLDAVSDIYRSKTLEGSHIVLHDTDKDSLKETQEVADKFKDKFGVSFEVTSSLDRKEALKMSIEYIIDECLNSGIKEIILPEHNRKDLEDVPKHVAKDLSFYFAKEITDVLEVAFPKLFKSVKNSNILSKK